LATWSAGHAQPQPAGRSSAASTKAVLSALHSLQDKLRRLEAERVAAHDQADRLRVRIAEAEADAAARLEATFAQARERAAATAQQVSHFCRVHGNLLHAYRFFN
jgi:septal ring factor EnvC (AmiA/AmiB activator)